MNNENKPLDYKSPEIKVFVINIKKNLMQGSPNGIDNANIDPDEYEM